MHTSENQWMKIAVNLSRQGMEEGRGGPFGAIIVKENQVIGKGCNNVLCHNDPTAHAEIMAIRDACKALGTFKLTDCEVYTSCEPCPMCMAAIYWAGIDKVYFANTRHDAQNIGFDDSYIYQQLLLTPKDRKIISCQIRSEEALQVFEEWQQLENKIPY